MAVGKAGSAVAEGVMLRQGMPLAAPLDIPFGTGLSGSKFAQ